MNEVLMRPLQSTIETTLPLLILSRSKL